LSYYHPPFPSPHTSILATPLSVKLNFPSPLIIGPFRHPNAAQLLFFPPIFSIRRCLFFFPLGRLKGHFPHSFFSFRQVPPFPPSCEKTQPVIWFSRSLAAPPLETSHTLGILCDGPPLPPNNLFSSSNFSSHPKIVPFGYPPFVLSPQNSHYSSSDSVLLLVPPMMNSLPFFFPFIV